MYPRSYVIYFCILPAVAFSFGAVVGTTAMSKQGALTPVAASVMIGSAVFGAMFLGFFFGRRIR